MASALAQAHITAKKHLQLAAAAAVTTAWRALPHYNRDQIPQFLAAILPITAAANQRTVALTEAYLAQALGRSPVGLDAARIVAGIRNGISPAEVYQRPFVTVWSALGRGDGWQPAVAQGLQRAVSSAATDVQLSFTHTLQAASDVPELIAEPASTTYQRVPDPGACDFCLAAADQTYHTADLMPLHNLCGCGVEVVTGADFNAPTQFPAAGGTEVAVQDHGELGPVLTNAADHFTGPADIPGG